MEKVLAPRILIGAPASGGGKTTFACGLMQAFVRRGLRVQACKCGPDYIDPMFHREVIGAASHNLDLFFMDECQVRETVGEGSREVDITVIEGVMGYYDGIAVSSDASAWDVARVTDTSAVLVVDGRGRARSIAAEVLGFLRFREPSQIGGVVLNRVSAMLFPRLKEIIEQETGVQVFGYVPVMDECALEGRHLGLITAPEVSDLRTKLDGIAHMLEDTVDIDGILALARSVAPLQFDRTVLPEAISAGSDAPVIAVAHDDAFCFYYDDTLCMLEKLGAQLAFFSPLADDALPQGTCGLYLGGGYPELHARALSENLSMRAIVREAVEGGMPTVAECGGFMYLHEQLEDDKGVAWPMAGVIGGKSFHTKKLSRFGYVRLTARLDGILCPVGGNLLAHEFHYWDSENPGNAFHAQKPQSSRAWDCVHMTPSLYAGYPHLCLHAQPEVLARFVRTCAQRAAGSFDSRSDHAVAIGADFQCEHASADDSSLQNGIAFPGSHGERAESAAADFELNAPEGRIAG